jgi:Flp pilus assembly pilin Flp
MTSKRCEKNKAQSFFEYTVVIILIVAALIAMGKFLQRSLQGKYRQSADTFSSGEQYLPK